MAIREHGNVRNIGLKEINICVVQGSELGGLLELAGGEINGGDCSSQAGQRDSILASAASQVERSIPGNVAEKPQLVLPRAERAVMDDVGRDVVTLQV